MRLIQASKSVFALALPGIIWALVVSNWRAEASAHGGEPTELTQVDLFGLPAWEQKPVSVNGFTLGITREQAFEIAKARNLVFKPNMPTATAAEGKAPCTPVSCTVSMANGNAIGVDLKFDMDRITKITVSVPEDADPEVKKVNVSREFKGLTRQFFNHYSDSLRNRIFGPREGKESHDLLSAGPDYSYTHVEYDYLQSGVIIHVTISKRDPKPFDLEVDFVAPK